PHGIVRGALTIMLHSPAMKPRTFAMVVLAVSAVVVSAQRPAIDAAFEQFWSAKRPAEAQRQVDAVLRSGVTLDDRIARLRRGRPYVAEKTGQVRLTNRTLDGIEHQFAVNVPDSYDPARTYQVRFQLHGGVMMRSDNRIVGPGTVGALTGAEQIYVVPY